MTRQDRVTNLRRRSSTDQQSPTEGARRGRRLAAGAVGVVAAVALAASPAVAAPPVVVDEGTYDQAYVVAAEDFFCGVAVTFHEVGSFRVTEFYDNGGTLDRATAHIGGTTHVTSAYGGIVNHWRQYGVLDPVTNTVTWSGNSFNLHGDAGGILANTSGHWITDVDTDEVLSSSGPQMDDEDIAAVCAVLEP